MRITKPSKATKVGVWWIYHNHVYNSHIAPYDGKWLLFVDEKYVDEDWAKLVRAFDNGELRSLGFTAPIPYKTNESTLKKIYGKGAAAFWA